MADKPASDVKIALLDIETAPIDGFAWEMFEANIVSVKHPSYMLCYSVKWLGDKTIHTHALPDYPAFRRDKRNDGALCRELWATLDAADIVIAHNGDSFDLKKINARFAVNKINPPSPFKTVDTLKVARRYFKFDSNKLDNLGNYLGLGRKLPHTGIHLWMECAAGNNRPAWKMMREYNARDIDLLEKVYLRLRPWMVGHPNLALYKNIVCCPACGSQNVQRRGFNVAKSRKTGRFHCRDCGSWYSGPVEKFP